MKRIITTLLIVTMIITFNFSTIAAEDNSFENILKNQENSIKEYNKLMEKLEKENGEKKEKPEYFGGCYIDNDGELVVLLIDDTKENIKMIKETTDNEKIRIKKVKYSYNEIYDTIDLINKSYRTIIDNGIEIISVKDDVINNKIIVGIKNLSAESEKKFRKLFKGNIFEFVEDEIVQDEATDIDGGHEIKSGSNYSTVGFCATREKYLGYGQYETIEGFVSTAHGLTTVGANVYYVDYSTSSRIGQVELSVLASNCDAAFVETNSNAILTDDVTYTDIDSVHMSCLPVGTYVTAHCMVNQGINTGKILSQSASDTFPSGWAYDLVEADYSADPGDSGSPIMYGKQLLGIHKGGNGPEYFVKYSRISGSLNCTPIFN